MNKVTRRDAVKIAGAVAAAGPYVQKMKAADQVPYAVIGTGSRGSYLLRHLQKIDNGRCVAVCDINETALNRGAETIGNNPQKFKDYREVLAKKDVEAVLIATPLFVHYPVVRDALMAGKHVFCEKCLVFKPEEVHGLRALAKEHPKQILQTGLQRRYSRFYQAVREMIDKGTLGEVKHVYAQWHRNMVKKPSTLWTMKPGGKTNMGNWRLYRDFSGGLVAELTSHQVDVADWMLGATPEFVSGVGGLDTLKDGRDVYDNVLLTFRYPGGKTLHYSSISTSSHLPLLAGQRTEMGEMIIGTEGTVHITVGDDNNPAIAMWYPEPPGTTAAKGPEKKEAFKAGATMVSGAAGKGLPVFLSDKDRLRITGNESFIEKELKFARQWLYSKGVMMPETERNPVDTELESFLQSCRDGKRPLADLEVGLNDSVAVMCANQAMDEGRRVYFSEIEKKAAPAPPAKKKA